MRIRSLVVERLRLFERVEIQPAAGINLLIGANGAGKTSLLEGIHLLSHGRSFRPGGREALIRRGSSELSVFASLEAEAEQRTVRLGLEQGARHWRARLDGEELGQLSRLFQALAVICFEPDSHVLVSGGSEHRRRFIDWALFHVEPSFIGPWRRYQRALKQRNILLKQEIEDAALEPWDRELAMHGAQVDRLRQDWLLQFQPILAELAAQLLPEQGGVELAFARGWTGGPDAGDLESALEAARRRDRVLGHTSVGSHRSDWSVRFDRLPQREMFSRGQEKLTVLALLLAQASAFARMRGEWPVLLLDDLPSELDARHLGASMAWLVEQPLQAFITLTSQMEIPSPRRREARMFHVEQAAVSTLV